MRPVNLLPAQYRSRQATGGLSGLIGPLSSAISHVEPWLTLHGLRLIFEKNQSG